VDDALLPELLDAPPELLVPRRVQVADRDEVLRRERRDREELDRLPDEEGVADPQVPRVDDPHHVAGERLVEDGPLVAEHLVGVGQHEGPACAGVGRAHPPLEAPRCDPQERHPVAVPGIHVGLHLEDQGGERRVERPAPAVHGDPAGRRRRGVRERIEQVGDPEVRHRRAEEDRRAGTRRERRRLEAGARALEQIDLLRGGVPGVAPPAHGRPRRSGAPRAPPSRRRPSA
jgi:hypothetical protein